MRPIEGIHIVGGGARNTYLNQATANATGRPVLAGPVEATGLATFCSGVACEITPFGMDDRRLPNASDATVRAD